MVMNMDGNMRSVFFFCCLVRTDASLSEYDVMRDTEEPQQILSFVPPRLSNSFTAEDDLDREITSFSIGKGKADWGPLTMYAVQRNGDVYAICPYMPKHA